MFCHFFLGLYFFVGALWPFYRFFVAFLSPFCSFFRMLKNEFNVEIKYLHSKNNINIKEFLPKRKILISKNHKTFQKRRKSHKKTTKKRQVVAFQKSLCSFLSPLKKATKRRQKAIICRFLLCSCPPQVRTPSWRLRKKKFPS
jgi:hypothetical protein